MKKQKTSADFFPLREKKALSGAIYPELVAPEVAPGHWHIKDIDIERATVEVGINRETGLIAVPLDASPYSREIRGHELAHVKLSPTHKPLEVNPVIMNAVEDLRINTFNLRVAGIVHPEAVSQHLSAFEREKAREDREAIRYKLARLSLPEQLLVTIAQLDTQKEFDTLGAVDPDVRQAALKIREAMWELSGGRLDFQTAYDIACMLQDQLADHRDKQDEWEEKHTSDQPPPKFQFQPSAFDDVDGDEEANGNTAEDTPDKDEGKQPAPVRRRVGAADGKTTPPQGASLADTEEGVDAKEPGQVGRIEQKIDADSITVAKVRRRRAPRPFKLTQSQLYKMFEATPKATGVMPSMVLNDNALQPPCDWLPVSIVVPPMPLPTIPPKIAKTRVRNHTSDRGAVPRLMHRMLIDQAVFTRRRTERAGISLLVDTSGSMTLTEEDMAGLLDMVPASVVASYKAVESTKAYLTILVQKGHRVARGKLPRAGGTNRCDLSALQWLANQPAPRYWLSDGGVFGACGEVLYANSKQVYDFIIANDIFQVQQVDELLEVLKKKRPLGPINIIGLQNNQEHFWREVKSDDFTNQVR